MSASQLFKTRDVEFGGKSYPLTRPNIKTLGAMASFLESRAIDGLTRQRYRMGDDAFGIAMSAFARDVAKQEYVWPFGKTAAEALNHPENGKEMLRLTLLQADSTVTRDLVTAMWDDLPTRQKLLAAWDEVTSENPFTTASTDTPGEAKASA